MTEWIAGAFEEDITSINTSSTALELWQNDDAPIHDRTVVDGFVTILTDTDELWRVDFYAPCPNFTVAADILFSQPFRNDPLSWYRFYTGRGPVIHRTRSKRTFGPNQELWVICSKEQGAGVASKIMVGWEFLVTS